MKKLNLSIVAAGMLVMMGTMESCKKENVQSTKTSNAASKSTAKSLTTAEVNTLVAEVNDFLPYVESFAANPNAQASGSLPSEMNDDDVIRYVENSFNFTYAQQEDKLKNVLSDEFVLTLPKNTNGKVSISEVASDFLEAYNHVKQVYVNLACPNDEKVLRVVDVSLISSGNASLSLKLTSVFEWGYDPSVPAPSASAISVPPGKWAGFGSMSSNNITSLDATGTLGSIEILDMVVRSNYGGYLFLGSSPKTKFSRYLVSNVEDVTFGYWKHASGADISTQNPWVTANWGFSAPPSCIKDYNSLVFYQVLDPVGTTFPNPLTDNLLNYMITWNDFVLRRKESALDKYLYVFKLTDKIDYLTGGGAKVSYIMETKYAKVYDRLSFPPLTKYSPVGGAIPVF